MGRHSRPHSGKDPDEPIDDFPEFHPGPDVPAAEVPDEAVEDVGRPGFSHDVDFEGAGYRGDEPFPASVPPVDDPVDETADGGAEYPGFPSLTDEPPSGPPPAVGGHRGGDDWGGGHRNDGGRRGVSVGVIVALVSVVVVVAAVIMWRFFGDALSDRSRNSAARCVAGKEGVAVVADPSIATHLQSLADRYNESAAPVGDHCVAVSVKSANSDAVVNGFIGKWPPELGERPALWIPGSSVSAARLSATTGKQTISDSRSLVTSPVLLAMRPELQRALGHQNWASLPALQSNPDGLGGLKLPGWGSLRLSLPISGNSDAAFLAAEAVAAASAPGAPATAGSAAVRTLIDAQPKLPNDSLGEAMDTLLKPGDPATAPVHAVAVTEQQLFTRGQSLPDAKSALGSWLPPGPAAVADYPTVLLSGSWLSQEQVTAANGFARFLHKPDQLGELAKAGFRAAGIKPPSNNLTSFPALPPTLSVGDDTMRATLADMLTAPVTAPAVLVLLDQSMTADEGGKTRLANVVAALSNRIGVLPSNAVVGLWTFDGKEGRSEVATGPLAEQVNGQPRSALLKASLDAQFSSAGGAVSFTTLRLAYQNALANFVGGAKNSVLVVTSGPHTDQTLDGSGLQDFVRQSLDPAKPVAVNVIDFGPDPDRPTWEEVAKLSSGTYRNLNTSASPDLPAAVDTFMS
jgi:hypothetical protein